MLVVDCEAGPAPGIYGQWRSKKRSMLQIDLFFMTAFLKPFVKIQFLFTKTPHRKIALIRFGRAETKPSGETGGDWNRLGQGGKNPDYRRNRDPGNWRRESTAGSEPLRDAARDLVGGLRCKYGREFQARRIGQASRPRKPRNEFFLRTRYPLNTFQRAPRHPNAHAALQERVGPHANTNPSPLF